MRRHVGLLLSVSFIILFLSSVANDSILYPYSHAKVYESYNDGTSGMNSDESGGHNVTSASAIINNSQYGLTANAYSVVRGDQDLGVKVSAMDTI